MPHGLQLAGCSAGLFRLFALSRLSRSPYYHQTLCNEYLEVVVLSLNIPTSAFCCSQPQSSWSSHGSVGTRRSRGSPTRSRPPCRVEHRVAVTQGRHPPTTRPRSHLATLKKKEKGRQRIGWADG